MKRLSTDPDGMESFSASSTNQRVWKWGTALALIIGLFLLVWHGPMPFEGLLRTLAQKDAGTEGFAPPSDLATVRHYYAFSLAFVSLLLGCVSLGAIFWKRLSETARSRIYAAVFTLAISCAMLFFLSSIAFEGPWLRLDALMKDPSSFPIFGHRVLFLWVAKAFQKFLPSLSNLRAFYLSQLLAALLAFTALQKWSAFYVGKSFAWAGQVLALLLMCLGLDYYVFYDIGTVFFTTCALIAIYSRRYWLLVPIVLFGTLNYEGTLLLLPLAAFTEYKEPLKRWLPAVSVSFVAYVLVRLTLQKVIPTTSQFDWRIWSNLTLPFVFHRQIASVLFKGALWLLLGLMSFQQCDSRLKRLALLFPLNFATSFLFGKLNEIRLFEACIPLLIAMVLSASMHTFKARTEHSQEGIPA